MIVEMRTQEKRHEKEEAEVPEQGPKSWEQQEFRHAWACLEGQVASGKIQ